MNRIAILLAAGLALAACSKSEKAWIVVDLRMPDGTAGQMAFDNPAVPDMTLADCRNSLDAAVPTLMQGIKSQPQTAGAEFVSAKCVESAEDPIKPR